MTENGSWLSTALTHNGDNAAMTEADMLSGIIIKKTKNNRPKGDYKLGTYVRFVLGHNAQNCCCSHAVVNDEFGFLAVD